MNTFIPNSRPLEPKYNSSSEIVISINELRGQSYGLPTPDNEKKPQCLLVGLDKQLCDSIGFPLLQHLTSDNILQRLRSHVPTVVLFLAGEGSGHRLQQHRTGPLRFHVDGRSTHQINAAVTLVDALCVRVRALFQYYYDQVIKCVVDLISETGNTPHPHYAHLVEALSVPSSLLMKQSRLPPSRTHTYTHARTLASSSSSSSSSSLPMLPADQSPGVVVRENVFQYGDYDPSLFF